MNSCIQPSLASFGQVRVGAGDGVDDGVGEVSSVPVEVIKILEYNEQCDHTMDGCDNTCMIEELYNCVEFV